MNTINPIWNKCVLRVSKLCTFRVIHGSNTTSDLFNLFISFVTQDVVEEVVIVVVISDGVSSVLILSNS